MENKATIKIDEQLKEIKKSPVPAEPIAEHLKNKCKKDESLASKVTEENKSLKECLDFVYFKVKEKLKGISGYLAREEVFEISEEYFSLSKAKIEKMVKVPTKSKQEIKEEKAKVEKAEPKPKTKKAPKKEKVITVDEAEQFSLFDM